MPASPRPPAPTALTAPTAPTAPFEVPAPQRVSAEPLTAPADETPGLTPWASEAIRLLAAELGCAPAAPGPAPAGPPPR